MGEVDSCTSDWREVFLGFRLEYLSIAFKIECSHRQPEKFVRHLQHLLSALTHLRLIAANHTFKVFAIQLVVLRHIFTSA